VLWGRGDGSGATYRGTDPYQQCATMNLVAKSEVVAKILRPARRRGGLDEPPRTSPQMGMAQTLTDRFPYRIGRCRCRQAVQMSVARSSQVEVTRIPTFSYSPSAPVRESVVSHTPVAP